METRPLISIIIPIYNAENYIDRAVNSVIAQNYENWELLLIDDGSTDKSADVCDQYALKDRRISVMHKSNGGAGAARNCGLKLAKGEYVIFVDSDDYVGPNLLSDYMSQPLCDVKISGIEMFWKDYNRTCVYKSETFHNSNEIVSCFSKYYILYSGSPCNKLYRLALIKEHSIEFPTDTNNIGEDHIFNLRYFNHCTSGVNMDVANYFYEYNPNSLTNNSLASVEHKLNDRIAFMSTLYAEINRLDLSIEQKVEIAKNFHNHLSDIIVRQIYLNNLAKSKRKAFLNGYKINCKSLKYNRLYASKGIFNRLMAIGSYLPTPIADFWLKSLFNLRTLFSKPQ